MKKYLLIVCMISALAVNMVGCGGKSEETLAGTEAVTIPAVTQPKTETETVTQSESTAQETKTETEAPTEESESTVAETTKASITEKEANALLLEAFGSVDEATGEKNVFTYEKIVTVDGTDYYSYKWTGEDGTYYCNAFVKTDGSDIMTGIYSDGKWELGSDPEIGGDAGSDEEREFDEEVYDDEDDSEDEPYDDGFGDIDPDYEEEAEDEFEFDDENEFEE